MMIYLVFGMSFCSGDSPYLASAIASGKDKYAPLVQCTNHMCPIRVHWHVKLNYKEYWRVKITITNFNYRMNYTQWNMVVQHPNFDNLTQIFSFNYKSLTPYGAISKLSYQSITSFFWLNFIRFLILYSYFSGDNLDLYCKNPF